MHAQIELKNEDTAYFVTIINVLYNTAQLSTKPHDDLQFHKVHFLIDKVQHYTTQI